MAKKSKTAAKTKKPTKKPSRKTAKVSAAAPPSPAVTPVESIPLPEEKVETIEPAVSDTVDTTQSEELVAEDGISEEEIADEPPMSEESQPLPQTSVLNDQFVPTNRSRRHIWGKRLLISGVLLLLLSAGLHWYIHAHPDTKEANKALIAEVAERAVLPTGENPSVTTVVDKDKINQSFLANAQNGDKVLLYFQASKAIVYRPSTRQIVNIGPLNQPPAQIFLRNGTSAAALPPSIRTKLGNTSQFKIVSQDTAAKRDYTRTLVVDITGNRPDVAARIAKQVGGLVSALPPGESPPDADILIIVGADAQ